MQHRVGTWRVAVATLALLVLASCGGGPKHPDGRGGHYKLGTPYQINGRWYHPTFDPAYRAVGIASWYGDPFHGRNTANGERFDKNLLSAAHPTLPLPSYVRVRNLENGKELILRVNDRGPFAGNRLIDLSEAAAKLLGFKERGLARVEIEFLRLAESTGRPPSPTIAGRAT
jgi:rare lipoprotein A